MKKAPSRSCFARCAHDNTRLPPNLQSFRQRRDCRHYRFARSVRAFSSLAIFHRVCPRQIFTCHRLLNQSAFTPPLARLLPTLTTTFDTHFTHTTTMTSIPFTNANSMSHQTSYHKSSKMGYEDSVYLAKLAEQAERYEGKSTIYQLQLAQS